MYAIKWICMVFHARFSLYSSPIANLVASDYGGLKKFAVIKKSISHGKPYEVHIVVYIHYIIVV